MVQVLLIMLWPMWTLLMCLHFSMFLTPHIYQITPRFLYTLIVKINEHYSPNSNINNFINYSYKWESISRDNWLNTLSEPDTLNEIISFGNEQFEKNKEGINNATTQLTNIFEELAQKSCKTVRQRTLKKKKRKKTLVWPWSKRFKECSNKMGTTIKITAL